MNRPTPLLVTFDFPPLHGGIQQYATRLACAYSALGYNPIVIAPQAEGDARVDAALPAKILRFRGSGAADRTIGAFLGLLRAARGATQPYTIALSWLPGLAAALLPRRVRGSLTLLAHGTELDVAPGSIRDRMMRFVFRRSDHVVANSAAIAARVRELGLARSIDVIAPGVDAAEPAPGRRSPTPTVLFVGRLVERKGADRLIDALALVQTPETVLHIVGGGPQLETLRQRARALGLAGRVRFAGAVDDRSRDDAFAEAWCFAMPSRRERGDIEGFGIVYLEAAVAGLAAIGGRDCGAEDAIEDGVTGLLVDGNDPRAIAAAIDILLSDRQRADAMGAAGRERALRDFTWRGNAEAIARVSGMEPAY